MPTSISIVTCHFQYENTVYHIGLKKGLCMSPQFLFVKPVWKLQRHVFLWLIASSKYGISLIFNKRKVVLLTCIALDSLIYR